MRAFVGYFTTKGIYEHVEKLKEEAKGYLKGKWIEPQNLHVTFQFLGDISQEQAVGVLKNLQRIAEKYAPFKVQYRSLGVFPDRKRPRILWMGVSRGENKLKRIANEVAKLNRNAGVRVDSKPFHPHVTICRIKEVDRKKLGGLMNRYRGFNFGEEVVDRIALISSSLTSIGPIYSVVEEFYFRRKED
ncbi:MAG: RNA 2',3'-cyclic phosphodiesterase [Aquificota bacterium]|nr:RNA 2',3'-cyclic phosphodiesterase [Aquificota bacterium]